MPARTTHSIDSLPENVLKIFQQVQLSTANHQKNFVALSKLHQEAAAHTESVQTGKSLKLVGEKVFEDVFIDVVLRTLPLKKGTTVADRIVKFVGGYVEFINRKEMDQQNHENENDDDTPSSRFVARLLKYLVKGFEAKDKTVRYRVLQIIAEMISYMGVVDEDIFDQLRLSLLERVHDKESSVRVQAVTALCRVVTSEGSVEPDQSLQAITDTVLDVLAYDQAPEVRRAALISLPLSQATLSAVLSRTRDVDSTIRKIVYATVLDQLQHPKQLTITQRELVIRNGLGDRESTVRAAAAKLIGNWVDAIDDLLDFIKIFDLMSSEVAEDALLCVFDTRPEVFDTVKFGDAFWQELTPEKSLLARVFVEHCIKIEDEVRLESSMPEVTALAFKIQSLYNDLLQQVQSNEEDRTFQDEDEEIKDKNAAEFVDRVFVMGELLKLAVNLDYADEIGRRKMFALVKDMVTRDILPETLLCRCLDVLRKLSSSERDLIRVVVEVIHDLRDSGEFEEDEFEARARGEGNAEDTPSAFQTPARPPTLPVEMLPEEKERADAIDLRCLSLCVGMLERVNSTFEENSTLEGILGELIVPAVKRKELPLREKGLVSLGLCCLIARRMALSSFQLFLHQVQTAPEVLKIRVLQIVFDIMMVHDRDFLGDPGFGGDKVIDFLRQILENEESKKVQEVLGVGLAKLMLSGMVTNEIVLKSLVVAYVSPATSENQGLRQCLSYFFPIYCYSSSINQRRMQQIFLSTYEQLSQMFRELDDDTDMVNPSQIGSLLVDWTDPQKAIEIRGLSTDKAVQVDLAIDIVKALFKADMEKDDKKVFCQLLGKLYFPDDVDDDKIKTLKLLLNNLRTRRPLRDTTAKNALIRFDKIISKRFEAQLASFNEEEYRQLEYLKELFEFLDDIIPDDDEEEVEIPSGISRKRRSGSITTTTTASTVDEEEYGSTPEPRPKSKGKNQTKRRRVSRSDEDDASTELGDTPPPAHRRTMPRRAATAKRSLAETIPDSEDEDEDTTPASKLRFKIRDDNDIGDETAERILDNEIDELLNGELSHDSIMDSDSADDEDAEDEEDEVNDLLGDA